MDQTTLIILCLSVAAALLTFCLYQLLAARGADGKLRLRLSGRAKAPTKPSIASNLSGVLNRMGQAAAQPFLPKDDQKQVVIRKSLARAGIYTPSAIRMVTGAKVMCLATGIVLGYFVFGLIDYAMMGAAAGGLLGYIAPLVWIKVKTASNQRQLTYGLADALDLMVVCVEAGLTVDAAMQRVGQEMAIAHPALSRELGMAHMETRVGMPRTEAMRNMGIRTGNAALVSLASMLIQADRFGTSIADALRVHSESLRINRQMAAEEAAGKASVKMSFPLVLCIFPATFIVLVGPTIIQLMHSELMK